MCIRRACRMAWHAIRMGRPRRLMHALPHGPPSWPSPMAFPHGTPCSHALMLSWHLVGLASCWHVMRPRHHPRGSTWHTMAHDGTRGVSPPSPPPPCNSTPAWRGCGYGPHAYSLAGWGSGMRRAAPVRGQGITSTAYVRGENCSSQWMAGEGRLKSIVEKRSLLVTDEASSRLGHPTPGP